MRTPGTAAVVILVGVALSACNQSTTQNTIITQSSGSEDDVQLIVSATPNPEGGLMITATAKNMGQETFRYQATCGRADMEFEFSDAEGHELRVTNPCQPQPMYDCPTALGVVLGPDGTATAQHWWSGKLWNDCTGTDAPAGDYRIRVTFTFYQDIEIGQDQVEASGTFHWSP